MKNKTALAAVRDVLGSERAAASFVQDLWGLGFTVVRRPADPLNLDQSIVPKGMAYQWNLVSEDRPGWVPVSYERHDGFFAPAGTVGEIECSDLRLVERPKAEVDAANAAAAARANKLADDWALKCGIEGISGYVRTQVQTHDTVGVEKFRKLGVDAPQTEVRIPSDLFPFISEVFAERDRIMSAVKVGAERTLEYKNAATTIAIGIVTERRKDEINGAPST